MRTAVFIVALLFIAVFGALTAQDISANGVTPLDVAAIVVLVVFVTGIVGALLHPPRE